MSPTAPRASRAPTEPLSGAVERVTYHSPESGFCVLRVQVSTATFPDGFFLLNRQLV
nr:hypothetical protein [Thiocapsa roseopersicina]